MAERLKITAVEVANDFWVERWTDDCGYPAARSYDTIVVKAENGREYILPPLRSYTQAERDAYAATVAADPETYYDAPATLTGQATLYWDYMVPGLVAWIEAEGEIDPDYYVLYEPDESTFEEKMQAAYEEEFGDRRMYA